MVLQPSCCNSDVYVGNIVAYGDILLTFSSLWSVFVPPGVFDAGLISMFVFDAIPVGAFLVVDVITSLCKAVVVLPFVSWCFNLGAPMYGVYFDLYKSSSLLQLSGFPGHVLTCQQNINSRFSY